MPDFYTKWFSKNEVIFKEGLTGNVAYILKKGHVEISVETHGRKVVLTTLKPVTVFGEMALMLKEHKRTATAIALEHSEMVEIGKKAFDDYVERSPQVIATVLMALVNRLQITTVTSSRSPDIFIGTSEILNLLAIHDSRQLFYDKTVKAISNALVADIGHIEHILTIMEACNLIELRQDAIGEKIIHVPWDDDSLERAMKIDEALKNNPLKQKAQKRNSI